MKRVLFALTFLFLPAVISAQDVPKIFIEAQQGQSIDYTYLEGIHTDNDLNPPPEIARLLMQRAQDDAVPLAVVFEKDKVDFNG
jgi:hypothetical protein